jgi:hypothetical protein
MCLNTAFFSSYYIIYGIYCSALILYLVNSEIYTRSEEWCYRRERICKHCQGFVSQHFRAASALGSPLDHKLTFALHLVFSAWVEPIRVEQSSLNRSIRESAGSPEFDPSLPVNRDVAERLYADGNHSGTSDTV